MVLASRRIRTQKPVNRSCSFMFNFTRKPVSRRRKVLGFLKIILGEPQFARTQHLPIKECNMNSPQVFSLKYRNVGISIYNLWVRVSRTAFKSEPIPGPIRVRSSPNISSFNQIEKIRNKTAHSREGGLLMCIRSNLAALAARFGQESLGSSSVQSPYTYSTLTRTALTTLRYR